MNNMNETRNTTLEQYLKDNYKRNIIDFKLRTSLNENGRIQFYIHADGYDSDTLNFVVVNDVLFNKNY
jgi:hypothetical protein